MKAGGALIGLVVLARAGLGGEVGFAARPKATRVGQEVRVSFAVTEPTDVEVAVLDAKGNVVRHLAAGVLGKNPPPPFQRDSLSQQILWDGRDDFGTPAGGGPFRVRVALGCAPKLVRYLGWDGNTLGSRDAVVGLAVGPRRELYVLLSNGWHGRSEVRVLDRDGKYLRTILPYPANLSREQTAPIGHLEFEGERLPIVFNGHGHNLHPLTSGMKTQRMVFSPKGFLLMASAVGTIQEHGPPRHLLALAPGGGAVPGVGFVGPQIRRPRNFLGGAGEAGSPWFDHLATSPDGQWIYLTTAGESWAFKQRHGVFRLQWADKELGEPFVGQDQPGDDDEHFNDPQGVAVDAQGNLYVCDRGNGRVVVFSAAGKRLGSFAVEHPQQITIHPRTGDIYIVSRQKGKRVKTTTLRKFAAWSGGQAKELARLEGKTVDVMALDPQASPPRLWAALHTGWQRPMALVPVTDRGTRLEVGQPANNTDGLAYPMFLAVDAQRQRAYVTEFTNQQLLLDLESGKLRPYKQGIEVALDRHGNVYMMHGWKLYLERYDPEGKPLPFAALGTHKLGPLDYRAKGPYIGLRGHVVADNGDIYILKMAFYGTGQIDVYGPDGKLKREALVARLVQGSSGLGVDRAGNIHVGSNLRPADGPVFPAYAAGKIPEQGWVWWRRGKRPVPWCYPYSNPYLYHWGAVFKFPPTGGECFGGRSSYEKKQDKKQGIAPPKAPPGTPRYRNGYLTVDAWVKGALWRYAGYGPVATSGLNWGDPSCTCWTARLAVDAYGRVFVPNVFRFSVEMLDSHANPIVRIGRYGNADSAGPRSRVPEPAIALAWPAFVDVAGGRLYVSDCVNRRVVVVGLTHAAEATCPIE